MVTQRRSNSRPAKRNRTCRRFLLQKGPLGTWVLPRRALPRDQITARREPPNHNWHFASETKVHRLRRRTGLPHQFGEGRSSHPGGAGQEIGEGAGSLAAVPSGCAPGGAKGDQVRVGTALYIRLTRPLRRDVARITGEVERRGKASRVGGALIQPGGGLSHDCGYLVGDGWSRHGGNCWRDEGWLGGRWTSAGGGGERDQAAEYGKR
jgi:hypothetical protein